MVAGQTGGLEVVRSELARVCFVAWSLAFLHLPPGAPRPVLPGAVERVVIELFDDLVDLAAAQEFDVAEGHRLHLQLGADFQIDRDEHRMAHRAADHGGAVAAHQRRRFAAEELRQIAAHRHVAHQQRRIAELVARIPGRHFVADMRAHMQKRLELFGGGAERNDARRMIVDDGVHVGPCFIDRAVNEALEVGRRCVLIDGVAVERVFDNVGALDALGCARARQEVMPRIVRVPRADVTERIDDALVRQNAIGRHQFFENKIKLAHHPLLDPLLALLLARTWFVAAARRGTQLSICAMAGQLISGDVRMRRRRAFVVPCGVTLLVGAAVAAAGAGDFPDHPIRVIVSVPAGGGVDTVTRIVTDRMRQVLGQPLVVENKPGVSGSLAAEAVFHAEPDGYTMLTSQPAPITTNSFLYKSLNYDPAQLVPLAIMSHVPNVVLVRKDFPAKTVAELIAYARANPTKINYASQGIGTTSHTTAELFQSITGTKLTHVPYKGTAPAVNDLLAGNVDLMFNELATSLELHKSGRARILAVTVKNRVPALPDIPTLEEAGVHGCI